tara:strand:+ start:51 stop:458 length:408 start_codon:yes stop_codon:yes gene_type:complete
MLLFLLSAVAFAEEPKFVPLNKGEVAPFSGRLFSDSAVSKLIVDNRLKAQQCEIEIDYHTNRAKAEEKYKYDLLEAKYDADKQRLTDMLAIRKEENEKLQKLIKPSKTGWWLAGGFMLGTATSITIMHVVKGDLQ